MPGLRATEVGGSHVPGSVWLAAVVVCGGWMIGRLEMGMFTGVWTGSCCVTASVVPVLAEGRGARVWVKVWVRAGPLLLPSCLRWFLELCLVVLVMLLLVVVVVVLLWAVLLLDLGSGFVLGAGSRLRRTSSWKCEGTVAGWKGLAVCCWGAEVACKGVRGPLAAWRAAAEEVVVLGDVGCAAMLAGAALWASEASAAG